ESCGRTHQERAWPINLVRAGGSSTPDNRSPTWTFQLARGTWRSTKFDEGMGGSLPKRFVDGPMTTDFSGGGGCDERVPGPSGQDAQVPTMQKRTRKLIRLDIQLRVVLIS